jgi:hypothetical protein
MKELALLAEVEKSEPLVSIPSVYCAGIWRYCLYATGPILPFMKDTFNRTPIKVNSIIVDNEEYIRFNDLEELSKQLEQDRGGWVNGGSVVYVRFPFHNPPYLHYSFAYGTLMGFTNGKPLLKDGTMYKPSVMTTPNITHSVDAFTYNRMKFNSANISLDNSDGQFDNARNLFGNEFNLKAGVMDEQEGRPEDYIKTIEEAGDEKTVSAGNTDEYIVLKTEKEKEKPGLKMLAQYYIENISVTLGQANFKLSDKRERLSEKVPSRQYTAEEYPDIDDNLLDKDMQVVYGHCFGVPGVCLEGKRIYIDKNDTSKGRIKQYRFRFSSQISRIDKIQVKMTPGEYPDSVNMNEMVNTDGWTTIWRREDGEIPEDWRGWKPGIHSTADPAGDITSFLKDGIITLRWDISKQGGIRENRINEVRMDGVFISFDKFPNTSNIPQLLRGQPRAVPRDIIKNIMYIYAYVPYDDMRYDTAELENELKELDDYEIGVMFDKSVSVYEAIEALQGGSVKGFQFQVQGNRFTARLDNPDRKKRKEAISHLEIININEVEVDWNASLYGSYTNIEYARNYSEKIYRNFIDTGKRNEILAIHRIDKEWNVKTLLVNEKDVGKKSDIILKDFTELRPIIKNIKLYGEKWMGLKKDFDELRVYDIVDIDFSIPGDEVEKYPQHIIRLIEEVGEDKTVSIESKTDEYVIMCNDKKDAIGKRDFMKRLTCQVISVTPDVQTGETTIDVRIAKNN